MCIRILCCIHIETSSFWLEFVNKNRCISVCLISEEVKRIKFWSFWQNSFLWPEYFIDFFMWKIMDPMSGFDICLMFTLPPRDSILQYKKCIHLWNNFPCIITLDATVNNLFNLNYFMCSSLLSLRKILNKPWNMFNQKMNIYRVEGSSLKSDPMCVLGNPLCKLFFKL